MEREQERKIRCAVYRGKKKIADDILIDLNSPAAKIMVNINRRCKRKRFVKLLMSEGMSRNQANMWARAVQTLSRMGLATYQSALIQYLFNKFMEQEMRNENDTA